MARCPLLLLMWVVCVHRSSQQHLECRDGKYGQNCDKSCSDGCSNVCDKTDGRCQCKDGWKNDDCTECHEEKYGQNCDKSCSDGCSNVCDKADGRCQCKDGWNDDCTDCQEDYYKFTTSEYLYVDRRYKTDCTACSQGCQSGTCDSDTGDCQCRSGWTSQHWNKKCDRDINECRNNPCRNRGSCQNSQGSYSCQCQQGFTGKHCDDDIDECLSIPCGNRGTCQNSEGSYSCQCQQGFTGNHCEQECDPSYYGDSCDTPCGAGCEDGTCDSQTGQCTGWAASRRCKDGYKPTDGKCDQECPDHYYGQDCKHRCGRCLNKEACDVITGHCPRGCDEGFYGHGCDKCAGKMWAQNCSLHCGHCADDGSCHIYTGHCSSSCQTGWTGAQCLTAGPESVHSVVVILATVAAVVFLALLTVVAVVLCRWRKANLVRTGDSECNRSQNGRQDSPSELPLSVLSMPSVGQKEGDYSEVDYSAMLPSPMAARQQDRDGSGSSTRLPGQGQAPAENPETDVLASATTSQGLPLNTDTVTATVPSFDLASIFWSAPATQQSSPDDDIQMSETQLSTYDRTAVYHNVAESHVYTDPHLYTEAQSSIGL